MHDFNPISFYPISVIVDTTLPASVVTDIPENLTLNYTLELFPSGGDRVAAAQIPFNTLVDDSLPSFPFDGRLGGSINFTRSIADGSRFGQMSVGYGELELLNGDGHYDEVFETNAIAGRRVLIKVGQVDVSGPTPLPLSYDSFAVFLDGLARDWRLTNTALRVTILDPGYKLDVPASPNVYSGAGGVNGTADMAGKRKPRAFGDLIPDPASGSGGNVTPAFIDPTNLVFQVNDGGVLSIPSVYDSGYPLTATTDYASYAALIAATADGGSYATCLALGLFRVFSTPYGSITCDVRGDISGTGFISDTASIARRILQSSLVSIVDEGSFLTVTGLQPAPIGYYLGLDEGKTVKQVIDELFEGILGWCNFRRDGTLDCGLFRAPGTSIATFTWQDVVLGSMQKVDLPSETDPPPYRVRMASPKNWTVQTSLVAGVTATRAAMLANPFAVSTSTGTALGVLLQALYNDLAQDPDPAPSFFKLASDGVIEANRRQVLFGMDGIERRSMYSFRLKVQDAFPLDIGDTITIEYPRYDLHSGKDVVIVGLIDDTDRGQVELKVWG